MYSDNKLIRDVADVAARIMSGQQPVTEKLHPNQQKLDVHEPEKDELTADDFKKLRAKKEVKKEEVEELDEDKYDRMLSAMLKGKSGKRLLKKHSDEVKKSKDIESGKTLNKLVKKNPGVLKTYSDAVKRDKKIYGEEVEVEEGWDDMMKAVKAKSGPQPSGGSGVKKGTRYGGSNQKDEPEVKEKPTAKTKKKPFSEMLQTYKSAGLKSLFESIEEKAIAEESMQEELEELSKDTLNSYVKKSFSDKEKDNLNTPERQKGLRKATSRLYKEDEEHIEELSTPTLASYVKKVGHEGEFTKKRVSGLNKALTKVKQNSMKSEDMDIDAINGVKMSTIGEEEMTDAEMKKREDIVKGMKKGMAGFKERYGDRAKSVMYATATKQAMKD